jgi:tetratricopeptide (TPR) repeat protein
MAFMSCIKEQNIPRDLLPPASELERTEALGTLKAFGFIKNRIGGTSYDMHRLVHMAMQNWLKLQDEWRSWNQKTLNQVTSVFPWPQYENITIWMLYLPHAHCITTTFNDPLSRTKETEELLGRLLLNLGICSQFQGKYAEAEVLYRESLQLREKVLGPEHLDTLGSINNLASSLYQQGKSAEAEVMHWQTLQLREKILGPEHPDTLTSINNLASSLYQQGKSAEAEVMHRQTLQLREKILGPEHPDTLASINNLASSLYQQWRFAEAEAMYRQTLQLREKVLGMEHPDTLGGIYNLALSLQQQGKYIEAEVMYWQTLQLREKILGPEHPDTLASIDNLVLLLQQQEKYTEAEAIRQRAGFKSHPDDRLHTTARKTKRKAEHGETWGPRRSRRIKESRAGC